MNSTTPASSTSRVRAATVEDAFPTPPRGLTPDASFRIHGRISPAPGKFLSIVRAQSTPPEMTNDAKFRHISRGTTGDLPDSSGLEQSWSKLHLSKKRSQYYSDAFAYREPHNSARERVTRDSMIVVEVKLSCCLDAEQQFLIDLSFRVSEIYHRSEASILVVIVTDTSMVIGGSPEPAYLMSVTALPSEIAATKNKRSAYLLQQFMLESLKIDSNRGIICFQPIMEENIARNGVTALYEIEQLEKQSHEEEYGFRALSRARSRMSKRSSVAHQPERVKTPASMLRPATPPAQPSTSDETLLTKSAATTTTWKRKIRPRKSLFGLFKRRDGFSPQ